MKNYIFIIIVLAFAAFIYSEYKKSLNETNKLDYQPKVSDKKIEALNDGEFMLDSGNSEIKWKGSNPVKDHVGVIKSSHGELMVIDGRVSGSVIIDMDTISGDAGEGLDGHLKSEDFFDVEQFPESSVTFSEKEDRTFDTRLTIKGIENEIILKPEIVIDGENIHMKSDINFDRTKWDVMYGSGSLVDTLKDAAISDEIEISINLSFIKKTV